MRFLRRFLLLFSKSNLEAAYDKYGRCQFKPGQAIVFVPKWWERYPEYHDKHPLKYGQVVHYLAEHSPARGHCIVTTYEGKIVTMIHPEDCRPATDEEV
jgi:hypothetical protein